MNPPAALVALLLAAAAAAQPAPVDADEKAFLRECADVLDGFAEQCLEIGYPRRAREIWNEVLAEYDPDDAAAREALGYVRVGRVWQEDPDHVFPRGDRPDVAVARAVEKRWERVCDDLGEGHREQADRLGSAGHEERARWHWSRCVRFEPESRLAARAAGMATLDDLVGTEAQISMLARSRDLERWAAEQMEREISLEPVPAGETHPLLDKGGIAYEGVRGEHFTVWGTWDREVLEEAARHAERGWAFCQAVLAGYGSFASLDDVARDLAFFQQREDRDDVLRANAELVGAKKLEFIIANAAASELGAGEGRLKLAGVEDESSVLDLAMRWPAQMASGFRSDALLEGLGHAVVGRLIGRNLVFTIGQEERRESTVTGREREEPLLLPDLSTWERAAVELAWQETGTPVAELPLLSAAHFPTDGRIKAWSFVEYMLRRSPAELRALDATHGAGNRGEVARLYAEATGGDVHELERSWREFWALDTPLHRAMRGDSEPLESFSKGVPQWLEAFNEARLRARSLVKKGLTLEDVAVEWSAEFSADCRQHAEYLERNRRARGPVAEHTQQPGEEGATNRGRLFASRALVSTDARDPSDVIDRWMGWPGYRDALLDPRIDLVGLYADGRIMVMDVTRGKVRTGESSVFCYPNSNNRQLSPTVDNSVPSEVPVAELGPDVAALLEEHGRGRARTVGYPLTMHFYQGLPPAESIEFMLLRGNDEVPGAMVVADRGSSRRTSAPGLVVFYPLEPLGRGVEYVGEWTWKDSEGRDRGTGLFRFQTR